MIHPSGLPVLITGDLRSDCLPAKQPVYRDLRRAS